MSVACVSNSRSTRGIRGRLSSMLVYVMPKLHWGITLVSIGHMLFSIASLGLRGAGSYDESN
jgi:hypothetical protein